LTKTHGKHKGLNTQTNDRGTPVNNERLTNDKTHGRITWQTGNHMMDMEHDMNRPTVNETNQNVTARDKTKSW